MKFFVQLNGKNIIQTISKLYLWSYKEIILFKVQNYLKKIAFQKQTQISESSIIITRYCMILVVETRVCFVAENTFRRHSIYNHLELKDVIARKWKSRLCSV